MKTERSRLTLLYFLFCVILSFLYRHCVHTHFLDDSLSAFYHYKLQGASGFCNSFDFPSLYYGHDLFYFGFYFLFGLNDIAWHLLFIALYSLNTLFLFKLSETTVRRFGFSKSTPAAFITCLLFLVCPYQTENILWVATLHYQISMLCLFTGIWLVIRNRGGIAWMHLFFALSLLTLEISLVFPAIWVIVFLAFHKSWRGAFKKIILPQALIICFYFISMKLIKGYFLPHYGIEHLLGWSPLVVFSTLLKYFFKLFGFIHFLDYPLREKIYGWCDNYLDLALIWFGIAIVISFFYFKARFKRETTLVIVLLLLAFIAFLPVLNMYFMVLTRVENDRLSFFATPFLFLIVAFLLTRLPVYLYFPTSAIILLFMKYLLGLYTWYWINAAEVQQRTLDSYHWFDKRKVYILNLPENFGGAYIYRKEWRFGSAMLVRNNRNILKQIKAVAGQNMTDINDGIAVRQLDSLTYDISKIGDNWFWNGSMGAFDYETDDYIFKLNAFTYTLIFKHPLQSDEVIIYHQGGNWKEVNSEREKLLR
jgi:hypothetical protein